MTHHSPHTTHMYWYVKLHFFLYIYWTPLQLLNHTQTGIMNHFFKSECKQLSLIIDFGLQKKSQEKPPTATQCVQYSKNSLQCCGGYLNHIYSNTKYEPMNNLCSCLSNVIQLMRSASIFGRSNHDPVRVCIMYHIILNTVIKTLKLQTMRHETSQIKIVQIPYVNMLIYSNISHKILSRRCTISVRHQQVG